MAKNSARASYINLNRPVSVLEGFFQLFYTLFFTRLPSQSTKTKNLTNLFCKHVKIWWKQKSQSQRIFFSWELLRYKFVSIRTQ